jgi:hypothetical protein
MSRRPYSIWLLRHIKRVLPRHLPISRKLPAGWLATSSCGAIYEGVDFCRMNYRYARLHRRRRAVDTIISFLRPSRASSPSFSRHNSISTQHLSYSSQWTVFIISGNGFCLAARHARFPSEGEMYIASDNGSKAVRAAFRCTESLTRVPMNPSNLRFRVCGPDAPTSMCMNDILA